MNDASTNNQDHLISETEVLEKPKDLGLKRHSLPEVIEIATTTMLVSHVVVMVLTLTFEICAFGPAGIFIGILVVLVLAALMAPITIPVSYLIGWATHRLLSHTTMQVDLFVRLLVILFEANLFGWIILTSIMLA